MKVVIDVHEKDFELFKKTGHVTYTLLNDMINGIPLPNDEMKYLIHINKIEDLKKKYNRTEDVYQIYCGTGIKNGKEMPLHNEIYCSFVIENGNIKVLSGWHIGTEDFEWEYGEDDYTWVLEKYHPGITEQIKEIIK